MTRNSIDIASRVSPSLSALLNSRVNNPECEQPVTLKAVRRFLADLLPADFKEAEQLHRIDVSESLLDELDTLIEATQAGEECRHEGQPRNRHDARDKIDQIEADGLHRSPLVAVGAKLPKHTVPP